MIAKTDRYVGAKEANRIKMKVEEGSIKKPKVEESNTSSKRVIDHPVERPWDRGERAIKAGPPLPSVSPRMFPHLPPARITLIPLIARSSEVLAYAE